MTSRKCHTNITEDVRIPVKGLKQIASTSETEHENPRNPDFMPIQARYRLVINESVTFL